MLTPTQPLGPSAGRAVSHPLWWAALALMALNDHVFKRGGYLPDLVVGKLSDITGLMVAPGILALVLCLRSRRALVGAHATIGLWFAAMNLWPEFAQVWANMTVFIGVPWHPVVDAADLWTLPALLLSWQLHAVAEPIVAGHPRRAIHRPRQLAAIWVAAPLLMANEPAPQPVTTTAVSTTFAPFNAPLAIGNNTKATVQIRVRALRSGVMLDCAHIKANPGVWLSRKLFAQAALWELVSGANSDFTDGAPAKGACTAYLVDGNALPMTLLFWHHADFPAESIPGSLLSVDGTHARIIQLNAATAAKQVLAAHKAVFKAPPTLDPAPPAGCELAADAATVAWSLPLPAFAVPWSIKAKYLAPDGCQALDLAAEATGASHPPLRWYLCIPPKTFPFAVGDIVTLAEAKLDHSFNPMAGVQISSGKVAVSAGVSGNVTYFGTGKAEVVAIGGCGGNFDKCGAVGLRAQVNVSGVSGGDGNGLKSGQSLSVGKGRTLHVVRAEYRVSLDPACRKVPAGHEIGPLVESVLVEEQP